MIYLTLPELLHVAERTLGPGYAKAAALLHSIARNHALIDGNKRLALAAVIAFYGLNGRRLTLTTMVRQASRRAAQGSAPPFGPLLDLSERARMTAAPI